MQIVGKSRIKDHLDTHHNCKTGLLLWHKVISVGHWSNIEHLHQSFPLAKQKGQWMTFEICNGQCFIKARIDFQRQRMYVRNVYSYADHGAP